MTVGRLSPRHLVALVCAAQVLVQIGAFFWPALLPGLSARWDLTNSEAGWITAIFYAAYMLSVPVLVTLTDRIDTKLVYLAGVALTVAGHVLFGLFADGFWSALACRALAGIGWAGTYMTGLKLLADEVDAKLMSRATAGHAASIGISGALSFGCAGLISDVAGWRAAFVAAGASAALAWLLVVLAVPRPAPRPRAAMAYAIVYGIHTLEMNALRGWGVAFLGFVAARTDASTDWLSPTAILTALGLLGTAASLLGNEAAIRLGRRRLICIALVASIACAGMLGFIGSASYLFAVVLLLVYGPVVWLDSSSLTAGTAGTAEPARRGATLAVHSMLGYAGGFIGPLAIGWTLDLAGGMSPAAWAVAFSMIAALSLIALIAFWAIRPRELAGDRNQA
jgi:MFS family permease